jgi:hypothetical protein
MTVFDTYYEYTKKYLDWWSKTFNDVDGYPVCVSCGYPVLAASVGSWECCSWCDVGNAQSVDRGTKEEWWAGRKESQAQKLLHLGK